MIHALAHAAIAGRMLAATLCCTAVAYYCFALYCARDFFARVPRRNSRFYPPITILKPVCGLDREAYENFASFCLQTYRNYQIVFGADRDDDPGLAAARRVARDFPEVDIRIVVNRTFKAANPKIATLTAMALEARHPLLLVSDSDIRVGPSHLKTIVGPMADPAVGVVTCLYRSGAVGVFGVLDALGLSTEFQPSVLIARKLEGMSFGMGSGILIRAGVLRAIGGFEAIGDFLADDYLLGHLPSRLGHRVELASQVIDHTLSTSSLRELVEHQIRWNRGIRAVRPWGYAGLVFTQGVPAGVALLLLSGGWPAGWILSGFTLFSRLLMAWFVGSRCLRDRTVGRWLWLVPLRDVLSGALWLRSFFGDTIVWRGRRYRLEKGGRLVAELGIGSEDQPAMTRTEAVS